MDIKKLRKVLENPGASKRPWYVIPSLEKGVKCRIDNNPAALWDDGYPLAFMGAANALLTVEAVNALPEALDEIERLRKEKKLLVSALEEVASLNDRARDNGEGWR